MTTPKLDRYTLKKAAQICEQASSVEHCAVALRAIAATLPQEPAVPEGWKRVSDVVERQVAWIDSDARHVAVVLNGNEYLLTLPPLPAAPASGKEEK